MPTYEITFEYDGGGTDRVRIRAASHHAASRDFNAAYRGERYIISCERMVEDWATAKIVRVIER